MTTKEEILELAGEHKLIGKACGEWLMPNSVLPEYFESFYHAARKDLQQEIERLKSMQARYISEREDILTELNKEQESGTELRQQLAEFKSGQDAYQQLYNQKCFELAAAQLQIKQYRDAFELQRRDKWHWEEIRDKALALPQDTTALEAIVERAGVVMRARCIRPCINNGLIGNAIRAVPGVKLEDLK